MNDASQESDAHRLLHELEGALDAEHAALVADDADAVQELANRKAELFAALESRHQALAATLRQADAEARRLRTRLQSCYQRNSANGELILAKLRLTSQTLDVIRNGEVSRPTYDAQGQSRQGDRTRQLGSV